MAARLAWPAWLLLAALASFSPCGRASGKQFYQFRVESRDQEPSTRRGLLRNATLPLHGAVKDYGYFYAAMFLGTPPKKFAVIVDTGSTMTYVPCASCGTGCGPNHQSPAFDPDKSSTAVKIGCSSPKCMCGSPKCTCSRQQCTYTRSYAEQSSSSGVLVEDLLALHDGEQGSPIIFGCETKETGEIYKQRADGLFGLGNSDVSVINQLVNAGVIDNVFSLCFGTVEGEGAMLLGDAPMPRGLRLQYTPLISSLQHPFYYNVRLAGLSVAGQRLSLDQSLFQQGYGTVLDSGTTFTYLPTAAFRLFAAAVERHALTKGLYKVPGPDPSYEDVCFGGAPHHQDKEGLGAAFPSMGLQFDQMEPLVLSPLNYLFVHTFNSGKYCLGVFDNGGAGTLLGGITFRDVLVRYDRGSRRVGFAHAACRELGQQQRPPCAQLEAEGIATEEAARSGDCQPVPPRAQQQEQYPHPTIPTGTGASSDSGSATPAGGEGSAFQPAGGEASSTVDETAAPGHAGDASEGPGGEGPQRERSSVALYVGVAVAAAAVVTLVAVLVASRKRLRGALLWLRPYRALSDEGADPEAGSLLTSGSSGGKGGGGLDGAGGGLAGASPGPNGSGAGALALPQPPSPVALKLVPLVEMGPAAEKRSPPRGLTTPTKLQRTQSAAAAALGGAGGGGGPEDEGAGGVLLERSVSSGRAGMLLLPPTSPSTAALGSAGSPGRSGSGLGRGLSSPR